MAMGKSSINEPFSIHSSSVRLPEGSLKSFFKAAGQNFPRSGSQSDSLTSPGPDHNGRFTLSLREMLETWEMEQKTGFGKLPDG